VCIEVVIERGDLETEGVGGHFVCPLPPGVGQEKMDSRISALRETESVREKRAAERRGVEAVMTTPTATPPKEVVQALHV